VTSIHQEYLDIIYDELSKQKFKLNCLKKQHEDELSLMRAHFEEQLEAYKASNEKLLQRIEKIIGGKKGVGSEPIKNRKEKEVMSDIITKAHHTTELEKVTGNRIPSSNSFNKFLRQVTSAVKGDRKLLKKNISLTEETEDDWTVILKNWKKEPIRVPKKSLGKTQTNRYSPFLVEFEKKNVCKNLQSEKKLIRHKTDHKREVDRVVSTIKKKVKSDSMTKQVRKQERISQAKKSLQPSIKVEKKKRVSWTAQLTKEELLRIALEGKKPKDCKYKLIVAYGLPDVEYINREVWASLLGIEEKFIPLIKDIKDAGGVFLIKDDMCVQSVQALYTVSSNVRVLLAAEEVARYISSNREKLLMIVNGLIPVWKKYVPVDKAIKVIKRGLAENSKVSQNEFFFDDVSYNDLKKGVKGYNSATNEQ
jgi:hypothetical protein